jgi:single-strand DNA-binding protein
MSDLNEVVISGRLTRDAELRQTPTGTSVTDIIVASNRIWSKDSDKQEEATFVDVTIWGKQAESLARYLTKGRHVMLTGRLKLNKWETEEGDRRSKLTVVAEKVNLTPGGTPGGNGYTSDSATSVTKKKTQVEEEVPF